MKLLITFILILILKLSFGQDTTKIVFLKPLSRISYEKILTREQSEKIISDKIDSINNTDYCINIRKAYKDSCFRQYSKELKEKEEIVKKMNSKSSGYYYYIYNTCDFILYHEFEGCGRERISCWDFEIMKKEKSRLILDGPTGEVYYNEDIRRMPH